MKLKSNYKLIFSEKVLCTGDMYGTKGNWSLHLLFQVFSVLLIFYKINWKIITVFLLWQALQQEICIAVRQNWLLFCWNWGHCEWKIMTSWYIWYWKKINGDEYWEFKLIGRVFKSSVNQCMFNIYSRFKCYMVWIHKPESK